MIPSYMVYDSVKEALMKQGMSEKEAHKKAQEAVVARERLDNQAYLSEYRGFASPETQQLLRERSTYQGPPSQSRSSGPSGGAGRVEGYAPMENPPFNMARGGTIRGDGAAAGPLRSREEAMQFLESIYGIDGAANVLAEAMSQQQSRSQPFGGSGARGTGPASAPAYHTLPHGPGALDDGGMHRNAAANESKPILNEYVQTLIEIYGRERTMQLFEEYIAVGKDKSSIHPLVRLAVDGSPKEKTTKGTSGGGLGGGLGGRSSGGLGGGSGRGLGGGLGGNGKGLGGGLGSY